MLKKIATIILSLSIVSNIPAMDKQQEKKSNLTTNQKLSKEASIILKKARIQKKQGKISKAIELLERITEVEKYRDTKEYQEAIRLESMLKLHEAKKLMDQKKIEGTHKLSSLSENEKYKKTPGTCGALYFLTKNMPTEKRFSILNKIASQNISLFFKERALLDLCMLHYTNGAFEKAIECFLNASKLRKVKTTDYDLIEANILIADIYRKKPELFNRETSPFKDILETISYLEKISNQKTHALANQILANFYLENSNDSKALEYFEKNFELLTKTKNKLERELRETSDLYQIATIYMSRYLNSSMNIGVIKENAKSIEKENMCKALRYCFKILTYDTVLPGKAFACQVIAGIYAIKGDPLNSEKYFLMCIDCAKEAIKTYGAILGTSAIHQLNCSKEHAKTTLCSIYKEKRKKKQYKIFKQVIEHDNETSPDIITEFINNPRKNMLNPLLTSLTSALLAYGTEKKKEIENRFTCAICKKTGNKLKKCGRCKIVYYCSAKCQRKDWKEHKKVCQKQ